MYLKAHIRILLYLIKDGRRSVSRYDYTKFLSINYLQRLLELCLFSLKQQCTLYILKRAKFRI